MSTIPAAERKPVIVWATAVRQCIINVSGEAPVAARSISMTFEAIYNAWAIYQNPNIAKLSLGSSNLYALQKAQMRRPTLEMKITALSYAAFTVLSNLYPSQVAGVLTTALNDSAGGIENANAAQVGTLVGQELIAFKTNDNSNQYGVGSTQSLYADTSGYVAGPVFDMLDDSVNIPRWAAANQNRWMPLRFNNAAGVAVTQTPMTPHWGRVHPFAIGYGSAFRPYNVRVEPSQYEVDEILTLVANLSDEQKAQVDLYAKNPGSDSPPGQWVGIAQQISLIDSNTLDKDVKLFFGVGQAVLDSGIAAWDTKYYYDSVRPLTYIRNTYRDQTIQGWGGSGTNGPTSMPGQNFRTYQRTTRPTPNFPEIVSGHSTFSAASAAIIAALRGSDYISFTLTVTAAQIAFDTNMPPANVDFNFNTLSSCADAAGFSRRLSGIHFEQGDLLGRAMGKQVGKSVYDKLMTLFSGY